MSNSGTPGLTGMLMDVISNETLEQNLRRSAAANLYSLIQRSWNPEVRFVSVLIECRFCHSIAELYPPAPSMPNSTLHSVFPCAILPLFASIFEFIVLLLLSVADFESV